MLASFLRWWWSFQASNFEEIPVQEGSISSDCFH